MRNATPEERLAALRMLRNEQMIGNPTSGDSTPRSRNRFSQRLSRTFGSRPHSGAATPRRNSGGVATGRTSPSAETHPAPGMETTAEEPVSVEENPAGDLSPMVETPSAAEPSQIAQAHTANAPHAAGSANVVNVTPPSEEPHEARNVDNVQNSSEEPAGAPSTPQIEHSIPRTSPSDQPAEPEPTHSTTTPPPTSSSATPTSPSEPNIAPFYSYR